MWGMIEVLSHLLTGEATIVVRVRVYKLLENWLWGKMTSLEEQESFSPVILKDYLRAMW